MILLHAALSKYRGRFVQPRSALRSAKVSFSFSPSSSKCVRWIFRHSAKLSDVIVAVRGSEAKSAFSPK